MGGVPIGDDSGPPPSRQISNLTQYFEPVYGRGPASVLKPSRDCSTMSSVRRSRRKPRQTAHDSGGRASRRSCNGRRRIGKFVRERCGRAAGAAGCTSTHRGTPQGGLLGGLGGLLQRFQQSGHGDIINSWIGSGQNQPITPDQLHQALGPQAVDNLSRLTGAAAADLISELSRVLPGDRQARATRPHAKPGGHVSLPGWGRIFIKQRSEDPGQV
jgi:uncharacterized protein YidB (DUF937 family)